MNTPRWRGGGKVLGIHRHSGTTVQVMKEALFREVSQDYLVPLFSGAKLLDQSDQSSVRDKNVGFLDPVSIAFKVKKSDDYRLVLTRPQPFAKESSDIVREIAVVRAFVEVIALMADALATKFKI